MVLSTGFCVLAGDLGSQLVMAGATGETHLDAWLETYNGGVSAGVIHTAEAMKKAKFPKETKGGWKSEVSMVVVMHATSKS